MGQRQGKSQKPLRKIVTFHSQVVDVLCRNTPQKDCTFQLAYQLTRIIKEYTGQERVEHLKKCKWQTDEPISKPNITTSTRRIRMLDRMVFYGSQFGYTHEDMYNVFYCVGPHVDKIIRINKGQSWESNNNWYIYDVYARSILFCIKEKSSDLMEKEWKKLFNDVDRIYNEEDSQKIQNFCIFLDNQLRKITYKFHNNESFGCWVCDCLEHFCNIGLCESFLMGEKEEDSYEIHAAHFIMYFSLIHPKLWHNDPFALVCGAVSSALTFMGHGSWGNWYRVECRTAVREGVLLDSRQMALLNVGARVHVVQNFGRRVFIDQPFRGFCSLHDGAGLHILKQTSNGKDLLKMMTRFSHTDLQSPFRDMTRWIFTDRTSSYLNLKVKFSSEEFGKVSELVLNRGKLQMPVQTEIIADE